jgi:hypothetical protein
MLAAVRRGALDAGCLREDKWALEERSFARLFLHCLLAVYARTRATRTHATGSQRCALPPARSDGRRRCRARIRRAHRAFCTAHAHRAYALHAHLRATFRTHTALRCSGQGCCAFCLPLLACVTGPAKTSAAYLLCFADDGGCADARGTFSLARGDETATLLLCSAIPDTVDSLLQAGCAGRHRLCASCGALTCYRLACALAACLNGVAATVCAGIPCCHAASALPTHTRTPHCYCHAPWRACLPFLPAAPPLPCRHCRIYFTLPPILHCSCSMYLGIRNISYHNNERRRGSRGLKAGNRKRGRTFRNISLCIFCILDLLYVI